MRRIMYANATVIAMNAHTLGRHVLMVNAFVVTGKAVRIAKPPHTVIRLIARASALEMLMNVIPMMRCVLMVIAKNVSFLILKT